MLTTTNTANLGYTGSGTDTDILSGTFTGIDRCYYSIDELIAGRHTTHNNLTIKNNNDHMNTQAKIAIFEVTRDEKGNINSSKFKVEFWMEKKKGASIELAAAKYLSQGFNPDLIVVKELYTASL